MGWLLCELVTGYHSQSDPGLRVLFVCGGCVCPLDYVSQCKLPWGVHLKSLNHGDYSFYVVPPLPPVGWLLSGAILMVYPKA